MKDITDLKRRILLIDDNPAIHDDFRKVLVRENRSSTLDSDAEALFGTSAPVQTGPTFDLDSAFQGEEALEKVRQSLESKQPYAMAFVDMRMPPGWDGLETIRRVWEADPNLETVICTAYSDHSWEEIQQALGVSDRLLILKKPFDKIEVIQLALALTEKWNLRRLAMMQKDGLEELVRQRTRELVLVNQSKSDFLANMSHELLTPMNGILGMATLLEECSLDTEGREYLAALNSSSQRLLQLLQGVLKFNTIEAGQLQIKSIPFALPEVCQTVADIYAAPARQKGLELAVSVDAELPSTLRGDPEQIKSVLSLLVDNAVKFSRQGRIQICARSSATIPQLPEVSVIDTGTGIDAARLDLLKHPLTQIDSGITRKAEGIGMGLTLAKQLLRVMGSRLEIQSQPGQGSTFSFVLPAAGTAAGSTPQSPEISAAA